MKKRQSFYSLPLCYLCVNDFYHNLSHEPLSYLTVRPIPSYSFCYALRLFYAISGPSKRPVPVCQCRQLPNLRPLLLTGGIRPGYPVASAVHRWYNKHRQTPHRFFRIEHVGSGNAFLYRNGKFVFPAKAIKIMYFSENQTPSASPLRVSQPNPYSFYHKAE